MSEGILGQQRFGLLPAAGSGPAGRAEARDALLRQLSHPWPADATAGLPDSEAALSLFLARRAAQRRDPAGPFVSPGAVIGQELDARLREAIGTPAPFLLRLALHWANHFTVSAAAGFTGYFAGAFEREAIRPNMLGSFEALLLACTTHPAMLFYLDNRSSVGPNSPAGLRRGRGLNENLAREVLELHSLGVDGGYTQADVQGLARILTGWSIDISEGDQPVAGRIRFAPALHEPGPQVVLGRRYADTGPDQARAVLRDLAHHPSTARHVTRRLVRHFLGDAAPPEVGRHLARVFSDTGGDLKAVTTALLDSPAAWELRPAKLRPPIELVLATARLLGQPPAPPPPGRALRAMGQPFQAPASPAGWPEEDDAWAAPDAVKTRLDWARDLAARLPAGLDARALLEQVFGPAASAETRRAVTRAADGRQAMVLLLMSPEYQRR